MKNPYKSLNCRTYFSICVVAVAVVFASFLFVSVVFPFFAPDFAMNRVFVRNRNKWMCLICCWMNGEPLEYTHSLTHMSCTRIQQNNNSKHISAIIATMVKMIGKCKNYAPFVASSLPLFRPVRLALSLFSSISLCLYLCLSLSISPPSLCALYLDYDFPCVCAVLGFMQCVVFASNKNRFPLSSQSPVRCIERACILVKI